MNKETELRIEKEAETRYFSLDEVLAFKCGAESEHPKAWNAAIEAVMQLAFDEDGDFKQNESPASVKRKIQALKLDPNQA